MIPFGKIQQAVELLKQAAPDSTIILFGSYARREAHETSDLDLLIIEPDLRARRLETVRLTDALRPLRVPVDIVVTSRKTFDEWSDTPGTVIFAAAREGKVLYAAA